MQFCKTATKKVILLCTIVRTACDTWMQWDLLSYNGMFLNRKCPCVLRSIPECFALDRPDQKTLPLTKSEGFRPRARSGARTRNLALSKAKYKGADIILTQDICLLICLKVRSLAGWHCWCINGHVSLLCNGLACGLPIGCSLPSFHSSTHQVKSLDMPTSYFAPGQKFNQVQLIWIELGWLRPNTLKELGLKQLRPHERIRIKVLN